MKKFLICVFIMLFSLPAFAMDVMLGAKTGYFIWRPFFKDVDVDFFKSIEKGDGVLYGPVISIIPSADFSFSLAGLFGTQKSDWYTDRKYNTENNSYVTGNYSMNVKRIDIDSALSYRLLSNLKCFAGYKFQSTESKLRYVEHKSADLNDSDIHVFTEKTDVEVVQHGPALGLGYFQALGQKYFVSANLSFLYMFCKFTTSQTLHHYEGDGGDTLYYDGAIDSKAKSTGLNFEPSIGATVDENLILTLGGRFQWIRNKVDDSNFEEANKPLNDYLYGIFVSALYML